ncbi:MAG: DUF885 family protein [Bernardetiaceae bacterium]
MRQFLFSAGRKKNLLYFLRSLWLGFLQVKWSRLLPIFAYGIPLSFVIWVVSITLYKPFNINVFYERMFFLYGLEDPELMSRLGIADRYGLDFFNSKLTDISDQQREEFDQEFIQQNLNMLEAYKRSDQDAQQLISTDILRYYLGLQIRRLFVYDQNYLVNHVNGVQVELPRFMIEVHQIHDIHDANNYLRRLEQFSQKIDQLIEGLRSREAEGVIAPQFIIDKVIQEIELFLTKNLRQNMLYRDFMGKVDNSFRLQQLIASRRRFLPNGDTLDVILPELRNHLLTTLSESVYPAYERLHRFLSEQREQAPLTAGAWQLPKGLAYYHMMLSIQTTTDLQPEDMRYTAEEELPYLRQALKNCLHELGQDTTQNIAQLLQYIDKQPHWKYTGDIQGEQELFRDIYSRLDSLKPLIRDFIPELPPIPPIALRRLPVFKESSADLLTYQPDPQTGQPVVYLNLRNINSIPRYSVDQIAALVLMGIYLPAWYKNQLQTIPTFRRVLTFDAFLKGWYAYVNHRLWVRGYFDGKPLQQLTLIRYELLLTALLYIDIEINYNQMSRPDAIAYLQNELGVSAFVAEDMVDQCIANPGTHCVAKVGQWQFEEFRRQTEEELVEVGFDERELNQLLLRNGDMPLSVLGTQVQQFIQDKIRNNP